ncbi:hypothetical protein [Streptomyces panaciradicis]|uniref:hypothetical protein n=1 Tax=Streptomyces panaciradicis TaxID=1470261 RepID=UPI00201D024A|nr:hypothetical protein [Streptomyces panaciradicis]MCL6675118.1 hypothetical protein [Streptomyces panaciradicis]
MTTSVNPGKTFTNEFALNANKKEGLTPRDNPGRSRQLIPRSSRRRAGDHNPGGHGPAAQARAPSASRDRP